MHVRPVKTSESQRLHALKAQARTNAPSVFAASSGSLGMGANALCPLNSMAFVAEEGGRWYGLALGELVPDEPGAAELAGLWVAPAARGRRLGAELVAMVACWARAHDRQQLRLWVSADNLPARSLYTQLGFVERPAPVLPAELSASPELRLSVVL